VQQPPAERLQVPKLAERGNAEAWQLHHQWGSQGSLGHWGKTDEVPLLVTKVPCLTELPSPYLQSSISFSNPLSSLPTYKWLSLFTDVINKIKSWAVEIVPKFPFFKKKLIWADNRTLTMGHLSKN
jgi:hypothetical protein